MARTLITKRSIAGRCTDLVGVNDHARVAEGGTLNGVFTRKGRPEEEPAGGGQLSFGVEAIRELVGMLKERLGQAMVSLAESSQNIVKTLLDFFVRKLQNALENGIRS